ncbi:hypothetical protein [Moritella sp. PE36]|uniref:hypothetical protein n=1 Tax=Moritella sp. PE36 TaxID=58051 RepID=UPI0003126973|nr:hypothetical protein [Moritella sp. PE36]
METVQSVINEIMFIAISRPDAIDITVEFSGISDSLAVKVMPRDFDYINSTTEQYEAAILYRTSVWLNEPGPMQTALEAKTKILELMATSVNIGVAA